MSDFENQASVYTYHNHYFDIGAKNAIHLQLFMEQSPSFEHLKQFVIDTYGAKGVKITPVENPVVPAKEKKIEHEELKFVERPKWEGLKFPDLPPVNREDVMEDVDEE